MKYKITITITAIAVALACFIPIWGISQSSQSVPESLGNNPPSPSQEDSIKDISAVQLADQIIAGLLSEKQFRRLKLTDEQVLEVFKQIGNKRGWKKDDELLEQVAKNRGLPPADSSEILPAAVGGCNQEIEMEWGYTNVRFPSRRTRPNSGECGPRFELPDVVLEYRKPITPRTSEDNIRWWSDRWYVTWLLNQPPPLGFRGRLSANGLCSTTVRVCVGFRAVALLSPQDLNSIYIWWRQ